MVPFVLVSSWALRNWGQLRARTLLGVAIGCQFAWLAAFDVCDISIGYVLPASTWESMEDMTGLPAFLFGCLLLFSMVRASTPEDPVALPRPADFETLTRPRPG